MNKKITKVCAFLLSVTMILSMTLSAVAEGPDEPASFPSHFDLRDLGYVTPVKSQGEWGTCWGFATIAAAETSLLSELGLTVDQFREKYGQDMDLSELQLAYFVKTPIPAETDASQAGEGVYLADDFLENGILNSGGMPYYAASQFASGVGPIPESYAPYTNKEGYISFYTKTNEEREVVALPGEELPPDAEPQYMSAKGDWSVDESLRFGSVAMLEDSNILPAPAKYTEDGKYYYNEAGTNAIKSELLKGRAVTIGYAADASLISEVSNSSKYMNYDTYAQYTSDQVEINHAVCIVGYDDNYSRYNFAKGNLPPEDGAWIVKNSWGAKDNDFPHKTDWGVDGSGYFYLSYYDQTISIPESFNFDVHDFDTIDGYEIYEYDYLTSNTDNGGVDVMGSEELMKYANIFTTEGRGKITSVSVETVQNAYVHVDLYKLKRGETNPENGQLITCVEKSVPYEGYHNIMLDTPIKVKKGDVISAVVTQVGPGVTDDKQKKICYVLPANYGINYDGFQAECNEFEETSMGYVKAVVNPGESILYLNGEWVDWADYLASAKERDGILEKELNHYEGGDPIKWYDFDNFGIKLYFKK